MEIIEHVAVIGGDRRQVELVHRLKKSVDHISVVGFDQLSFADANVTVHTLSDIHWGQLSAILFPVSGVNTDGEVEAQYAPEPLIVTREMLAKKPKNCIIFTGIRTEFLNNLGENLVCWMERDDVAVYNSVPTAEGALMLAMQHTSATIHNATVVNLGFGRCGVTIADLFQSVGAKVTVVTDDDKEKARAYQAGHRVKSLCMMHAELACADICINTIPAPVLAKDTLPYVKESCYILDIASRPGGIDMETAGQLGLQAQEAPGLPGKVAPETAGEILAIVTLAILKSENNKKG
ncbi:dipicolinate synthase subunit DpsA [Salicibibacter cibarius]|uniref:Dipicolinate synthase subunit DpsA n=1 Tax=Salicibibacter cibarius TaxID=2743000 RepID=A0A7T7CBU6_9BACI|nr:dipicolinate synthase subunit DpsA [Salicibibacter cibarius]QQK76334.1 dipicolinate synthase subunit DpsA [Salicibibacter cibarius]